MIENIGAGMLVLQPSHAAGGGASRPATIPGANRSPSGVERITPTVSTNHSTGIATDTTPVSSTTVRYPSGAAIVDGGALGAPDIAPREVWRLGGLTDGDGRGRTACRRRRFRHTDQRQPHRQQPQRPSHFPPPFRQQSPPVGGARRVPRWLRRQITHGYARAQVPTADEAGCREDGRVGQVPPLADRKLVGIPHGQVDRRKRVVDTADISRFGPVTDARAAARCLAPLRPMQSHSSVSAERAGSTSWSAIHSASGR